MYGVTYYRYRMSLRRVSGLEAGLGDLKGTKTENPNHWDNKDNKSYYARNLALSFTANSTLGTNLYMFVKFEYVLKGQHH